MCRGVEAGTHAGVELCERKAGHHPVGLKIRVYVGHVPTKCTCEGGGSERKASPDDLSTETGSFPCPEMASIPGIGLGRSIWICSVTSFEPGLIASISYVVSS